MNRSSVRFRQVVQRERPAQSQIRDTANRALTCLGLLRDHAPAPGTIRFITGTPGGTCSGLVAMTQAA
jgi:hypothetical protein